MCGRQERLCPSSQQLCQRQQDVKSGSESNMGVTSRIHYSALLTVIHHNFHSNTNETGRYDIQCNTIKYKDNNKKKQMHNAKKKLLRP